MSNRAGDRPTPNADGDPSALSRAENWRKHVVRAGSHFECAGGAPDPGQHREHVEPWLSALFQAEHLNLLVGSGLTTAIAKAGGAAVVDMSPAAFECSYTGEVMRAATEGAKRLRRENPNVEDQVRAINELIGGLRILTAAGAGDRAAEPVHDAATALQEWKSALDATLAGLLKRLLATERGIATALAAAQNHTSGRIRRLLGGFLLPFASRTATRERTHIFTTNYDRLIERGCDLLGLRVVDRFVGSLAPVFHSSRLGIDLHYNPPGIRGEPRYLEGHAGRDAQVSLLVGSHFGDLATLIDHYLPKPAIDRTTWRMIDLLNRRTRPRSDDGGRMAGDTTDREESA